MRLAALALAAAALVGWAGGAWATGKGPCIARAHKGAVPYNLDTTVPTLADTSHGNSDPGPNDAEVAGIDRDGHGQVWVYRVHEFAWRRQDVDLRGDCSGAGP